MKKIGIIGYGNIAKAMVGGMLKAGFVTPENVLASSRNLDKLNKAKLEYGINITMDNKEVAEESDVIILCVKPHLIGVVGEEIKDMINEDKLIVSVAAGIKIEDYEDVFGDHMPIVRCMPNTPVMVGEGMTAIAHNKHVHDQDLEYISEMFHCFGKAEVVDEGYMAVITALSGSSPAYVFMFIEALADGAVLMGLPRDKAYRMAAQSVHGAAKLVLETEIHPGELKDMVCSPGGSTIDAVFTLEKNNFRGTVISTIESSTNKVMKLSEQNKRK